MSLENPILATCGIWRFEMDADPLPKMEFLGSGFLVEGPLGPIVVTARHVVQETLQSGGEPHAMFMHGEHGGDGELLPVHIAKWVASRGPDIAFGLPLFEDDTSAPPSFAIWPASAPPPFGPTYGSVEWADSRGNLHGGSVQFDYSQRRGYLTKYYVGDTGAGDAAGYRVLEMSYPALKGASGAPVFFEREEDDFVVVGVIISNRQRALLPAHLMTVYADDGTPIESIQYHLPSAVALDIVYLKALMTEAIQGGELEV